MGFNSGFKALTYITGSTKLSQKKASKTWRASLVSCQ